MKLGDDIMNIEKTVKNLNANGFSARVFENSKEAGDFLENYLKDEVIGIGGSKTVNDMGLYDILCKNNKVYWHWLNKEDRDKCSEFTAYICSANAVSETGELVNIDGHGNRVASTLFGPKKLFFVVGWNKICPDIYSAIDRAKNIAVPLNAKRLGVEAPDTKKDDCLDFGKASKICSALTIYMRPCSSFSEVNVLIVKEDLGF